MLRHIGNPASTQVEKLKEAQDLLDGIQKRLEAQKMTGHVVLAAKCRVHTALCIGYKLVSWSRDQNLTIVGYRDVSLVSVLSKNIPQCAQLGGALIGVLTVASDLVGCIGSGTGILLTVSITYSYFEQMAKEQAGKGQMALV